MMRTLTTQIPSKLAHFTSSSSSFIRISTRRISSLKQSNLLIPNFSPSRPHVTSHQLHSTSSSIWRWCKGASIVIAGTTIELPFLVSWRVLRIIQSFLSPPLVKRICLQSLRLLTIAYHVRIRWCTLFLSSFNIRVKIKLPQHTSTPFPINKHPLLLLHCNQHSLIESIAFHSASYLHLLKVNQTGEIPPLTFTSFICSFSPTPFRLSTPHFFMNLEWAAHLFGWVHSLTGIVIVRQWKAQAIRSADKMIKRVNPAVNFSSSSSTRMNSINWSSDTVYDCFYLSPEGKRNLSSTLLPYKTGFAYTCIAANASYIPIVMIGAREIWPVGEWKVGEGEIEVIYGDIQSLVGRRIDERKAVAAQVRMWAEKILKER